LGVGGGVPVGFAVVGGCREINEERDVVSITVICDLVASPLFPIILIQKEERQRNEETSARRHAHQRSN
jgi:hypothetical protein